MARADLNPSGRAPTSATPTTGRPVAPSRRTNPRLVIVALLLGLLVAAGALKAMSVASKRSPALVLRRDVPTGTEITADMLGTVPVASDGSIGALGPDDRVAVVGRTARHRLVAGDLLRASDLTDEAPVGPDQRRVGARLDRGRFPYDLEAGTRVRVVTEAGGSYVAVVLRLAPTDDGGADIVLVVNDVDADAVVREMQAGEASLVAESGP